VSGPATISGSIVTLTGAGTVVLSASQAAAGNYAIGSQNATFNVATETPAITFAVPGHTYGDVPFAVTATSPSAGLFTYAVVSGPATIMGTTVTITGAGIVVVSASQAAAGNYAIGSQNATFSVALEVPALAFTPISPQTTNGVPFPVSASDASTGAIVYAVVSGPATISGATVTITGAGTVVLSASQAAAGNYAAVMTTATFVVTAGFTVAGSGSTPGAASADPGGVAAFSLALAPPGSGATFPDPVLLTITGLPSGATATFTPGAIPSGSGPLTVTLSIQLPAVTATERPPAEWPTPGAPLAPVALGLLLTPLAGVRRARRWLRRLPRTPFALGAAFLLLAATAGLSGCGSKGSGSGASLPSPTSYTLVVTATDTVTGAHSSTKLTLTVE
jgi:hypothetical protein